MFTQKTGIVSDQNALLCDFLLSKVLGDALTNDSDISDRKLVPQNGSPP